MIEGLRYLPRVQAQRDEANGAWYLDCETCTLGHEERRRFRCAFVAEKDRLPQSGPEHDANWCPGYTTSLPDVIEAARALSWRRDGQLGNFYDLPVLLRDCVDILDVAAKQEERESMRKRREEMDAKRGR